MNKRVIVIAGVFGALAIVLGAFGAHALKNVLSINELNTFEVGVRYQFYHALFLLLIAFTDKISIKIKKYIGIFTSFGILMFSGSIYLLATQSLTGINFKFLGPVTPIGGLFFIIAWVLLIVGAYKGNITKEN